MTPFLALALWVTVPTLVLVVGAWLIEHADAEQGPPPTLRPDVRAACEEAWAAEVAYLEHVAEALVLAQRDGVVVPMQRRGQ